MITCGIDIGKGRHAAALLDESGREIGQAKFYDNTRQGAEKLLERLRGLSDLASVRVGMESTGNYWRAFYDHLTKAGCRVDVINPIVTKASSAGDIRGRKTDKRDALVIADVVFRGNYVAKPAENGPERGLKVLTRQRGFLVGECTAAKLHMLDSLSETFPEFESLFEEKFGNFALAVLEKYPGAHALARAHLPSVMKIVKEHTRGKDVEAEAKKMIAAAKDSICADCAIHEEIGECIRSSVKTIRDLRKRIGEVEKLIEACDPPKVAELIMPIKGSGKLLPKIIAAEIGDIGRFLHNPKTGATKDMHKRLLAYSGSEPRRRESGKWRGQDFISKRGPGQLRTALYLIGNTIRQWDPNFKEVYDRKIAEKKHHNEAVICVFAKLLEIVCSLYKTGRTYTVEKPSTEVINNRKVVNNEVSKK